MTLVEGIKHKGKPFEIPDCTRNDLPVLFKELGYKIGVEVGVYKGEFTKVLAESGAKIYGIDPWGKFSEYPNTNPKYLARQEFLYGHTQKFLSECPNVKLIRKTSMDAVREFPERSIDFVYIDGEHKFRYIAEDLYEWSKRVRKGGIISGHDYFNDLHVNIACKSVIDAYVNCYRIKNFYVIGEEFPSEGHAREMWRSWFWIKA